MRVKLQNVHCMCEDILFEESRRHFWKFCKKSQI